MINDHVTGNLVDPTLDAFLIAQTGHVLVDADKDLLQQVIGDRIILNAAANKGS